MTLALSPTGRWICALAIAAGCAATGASDSVVTTTTSTRPGERSPLSRDAESPVRRTALAARARHAVAIDGSLDEPAWADAAPQSEFWQRDPHEGAPPRFPTEFRVLYDHEALYVGVRGFDPEPHRIRGLLTRRDQLSSSDWISVNIDSYHDRRTAFSFGLNPAGVHRDILFFNDVEADENWDAVWTGAAKVDDRGWVAEFRIPYNQLRFSPAEQNTWGLQVIREVQRENEVSAWVPWPKEKNQNVSLYGDLQGVSGISPGQRLELLPYAKVGGSLYESDGDPLNDGVDGIAGAGIDAKYGLGPNFTLSASVLPDFGQVEADPSEVNLTASETFFVDKRPLFTEGTDIFRFSLGQGDGDGSVESLFYSRRIGAAPHFDGDGDFVSQPDQTTIYGAAKLSGKTAGGWSFGLLEAVTGQEKAEVIDAAGMEDEQVIEPLTNYAVGRAKRHLNDGRTELGAAITAVHRSLDGNDLPLHSSAYSGGLQATHRFPGDEFNFNVRLVGSHVRGSEEAIDETQRASQRYFQRPDASHLDYDPTRTSLSGGAALWDIGKSAGGHTRFAVGGDAKSPGFEVNDLGFQRGADYYTQWVWGQYREDLPGKVIRQWMVNVNAWSAWDWSPEHLLFGGNVNGGGSLLNYWGGHGGIGINGDRQLPSGLRGGPKLRGEPSFPAWFNLWSDSRKAVSASVSGNVWVQPSTDSWSLWFSPGVSVQAASNIEIGASAAVSRRVDDQQYVDELVDADGEPVYLMGRIDQITTALTLRMSYTFTPRLSLQIYAQPFVATGEYEEYKEAVEPQAERYDDRYAVIGSSQVMDVDGVRSVDRDGDGVTDYSFDLADFNFRELRSNVVLRWEYLPGSTLFFIWSHNRTSEDELGRYSFSDELDGLVDQTGEHVLLLKLNYWFGI